MQRQGKPALLTSKQQCPSKSVVPRPQSTRPQQQPNPVPSVSEAQNPTPAPPILQLQIPTPALRSRKPKTKLQIDIIGDSNVRSMGELTQADTVASIGWVNPGARIQDMVERVPKMLSPNSEAVVLHLGTNNILDPNETTSDTVKAFDRCIKKISHSVRHRRLLIYAVPPYKDDTTTQEVKELNCFQRRKCTNLGLTFIDSPLSKGRRQRQGTSHQNSKTAGGQIDSHSPEGFSSHAKTSRKIENNASATISNQNNFDKNDNTAKNNVNNAVNISCDVITNRNSIKTHTVNHYANDDTAEHDMNDADNNVECDMTEQLEKSVCWET